MIVLRVSFVSDENIKKYFFQSSIFLKRPGLFFEIIHVGHFQEFGTSPYFVPAGMSCLGSPISSS